MPWVPPLLQEDDFARRYANTAPSTKKKAPCPSSAGGDAGAKPAATGRRGRPIDLRAVLAEARVKRLLQVREAGKELAASIRKDYQEKKDAGRERVLTQARESWEEELQDKLASLTVRLQRTARVIGAGHRQASAQKAKQEAQREAKVWEDRRERAEVNKRALVATQAHREHMAEVHRLETEAMEREQLRRDLGRKSREEAHAKAERRAAQLAAEEEEERALAELRANPQAFLEAHTGLSVIESGPWGLDAVKTRHPATVIRHGPLMPDGRVGGGGAGLITNQAEGAREQAARAREQREAEEKERAERQKEREDRAAEMQHSMKVVQAVEQDLVELAALDRRRKQHKSSVLARSVLAQQLAANRERLNRRRAEEDFESTLLAYAPIVAPGAAAAGVSAGAVEGGGGGLGSPLEPPRGVTATIVMPPPPPSQEELTWTAAPGGAARARGGGARRGEGEEEERDEETGGEGGGAEGETARLWEEMERLKGKIDSLQHNMQPSPAGGSAQAEGAEVVPPRRRQYEQYAALERFTDEDEEPGSRAGGEGHRRSIGAPGEEEAEDEGKEEKARGAALTDWEASKSVISDVLRGIAGGSGGTAAGLPDSDVTGQRGSTLPVVQEEAELEMQAGDEEEEEEDQGPEGLGSRGAAQVPARGALSEEEAREKAYQEVLARAQEDLRLLQRAARDDRPEDLARQAGRGEGAVAGDRRRLEALRERGLPFDPKLDELEAQRKQLAEVRAITRGFEASTTTTEPGSAVSVLTPSAPAPPAPTIVSEAASPARPKPPSSSKAPAVPLPHDRDVLPSTLPTEPLHLLGGGRPVDEKTAPDMGQPLLQEEEEEEGGGLEDYLMVSPPSDMPAEGAAREAGGASGGNKEAGVGRAGARGQKPASAGQASPPRTRSPPKQAGGSKGRGGSEGKRKEQEASPVRGASAGVGARAAGGAAGGARGAEQGQRGRGSARAGAYKSPSREVRGGGEALRPLTPSSDVLSDLTVMGDSSYSYSLTPHEARRDRAFDGNQGADDGRGSTPSALSSPRGLGLVDQGLSDDDGLSGLESYSLEASSSGLHQSGGEPARGAGRLAGSSSGGGGGSKSTGEVVLVSSTEHGVEISLSEGTLSSSLLYEELGLSPAPASSGARHSQPLSTSQGSGYRPSFLGRDPEGAASGKAGFTEQELPGTGEGDAQGQGGGSGGAASKGGPSLYQEREEGRLLYGRGADQQEFQEQPSVGLASSTSEIVRTLQDLHGEDIDLPGEGEYEPDSLLASWEEGAQREEEEEEAGLYDGGADRGERVASVFEIPLSEGRASTGGGGGMSLQEQFLARKQRLAQRFEERRRSREGPRSSRPSGEQPQATGDTPRGGRGAGRSVSFGGGGSAMATVGSRDRRRSSAGGTGTAAPTVSSSSSSAPHDRLVGGRREVVDMREAKERSARLYANLPEVRQKREEEERVRARIERARKAAELKKMRPRRGDQG